MVVCDRVLWRILVGGWVLLLACPVAVMGHSGRGAYHPCVGWNRRTCNTNMCMRIHHAKYGSNHHLGTVRQPVATSATWSQPVSRPRVEVSTEWNGRDRVYMGKPAAPVLSWSRERALGEAEYTPREAINWLVSIAGVGPGDTVYDPGAGDGRLLFEAARRGATCIGVEIRPEAARLLRRQVAKSGLPITVIEGDSTKMSVDADVVLCHMYSDTLEKLWPMLSQARIVVAYGNDIPGVETTEYVWDGYHAFVWRGD